MGEDAGQVHCGVIMAEKKDKRPWWKKKTNWGLGILAAAGTLAVIPNAPILFTIGSAQITTTVVATALTYLGNALGVYGVADRVSKGKGDDDGGGNNKSDG